jgi:urease beta subunit
MKPLYKSDDIFISHTFRRNLTVEVPLFFGEFLFTLAFDREYGIGMNLLYSKIASVGFENGRGLRSNAGLLEKSKIMPFPIGK